MLNEHLYRPDSDGTIVCTVMLYGDGVRILRRNRYQMEDYLTDVEFNKEYGSDAEYCYEGQDTRGEGCIYKGIKTYGGKYYTMKRLVRTEHATEKELVLEMLKGFGEEVDIFFI